MTADRDEVETAFRQYWQLGAVDEDWDAWCDACFTDDVTYVEHVLGNRHGREEVRAWIKPTMEDYGSIYTVYEWHMIGDDGRVVVSMQNRRDHPEPDQPPIDFRGITVLQYARDGRFSLEEDFWSLPEGIETMKRWTAATRDHPEFVAARTRRAWGTGPEWTIGAATYLESRGARRTR
jgi:limonene-1,2-epoxide hydrolase